MLLSFCFLFINLLSFILFMCLPPFAPTLIFPSLTLALLSVYNICWHNGLRFQAWVDAVTMLQLLPGATARRGKACCLDTWERLQSNSTERRQGQRVMFSGTKSSSCHVNGSLALFLQFFSSWLSTVYRVSWDVFQYFLGFPLRK